MKKEKTLHEQKVDIKRTWEDCFKIKMEDKLTEEGVKKFWSDDFTIKECFDLLTEAGIDHVAGKIVDDLIDEVGIDIAKAGGIIAIARMDADVDDWKEAQVTQPEEGKYRVLRQGQITFHTFDSIDEAEKYIQREACTSELTIDDFQIVKEL